MRFGSDKALKPVSDSFYAKQRPSCDREHGAPAQSIVAVLWQLTLPVKVTQNWNRVISMWSPCTFLWNNDTGSRCHLQISLQPIHLEAAKLILFLLLPFFAGWPWTSST